MSQADMSPDASPGQTKKTGVRRVNNMPMFIGAGALLAFMAVMMMVAADRAAQQNAEAEATSERAGSTSMFAHEIAGDLTDGIVAAERLEVPPAEELEVEPTAAIETAAAPLLVEPTNFNVPPTPPSHFEPQMQDDEADRIRMAKLQMLEEAARAKTSVQVSAPRSSGSSLRGAPQSREDALAQIAAARQQIESTRTSDPTAAYQARLNQVRNQMGGNSFAAIGGFDDDDGPSLLQVSASNSQRNSLEQFKSGEDDRWSLDSKPEAPRSPYELRAGFTVPATLVSGINSDLPGQIMAQVSQNVYDTATGRHLLIPQGSRLVGSYSSDVAYGQNRVMVGWQRIVFPDGKAMDIGAMPGSDVSGYSGFKDKVNNHYFRLFGSAFLMSGVTAGITLSQDNNNSGDRQRASDAMSEALGQQLGQVTAQLIARNMNISPTIEIRPGFRFNVIVTKDMTFSKPYRSFDY